MYALSPTEQREIIAQICTPKEREAWEAIEIRQLSLRRASIELGVSLTSTKDRIASAREKVKHHLEAAFPARTTATTNTEPRHRPTDEQLAVSLLIQRDGDQCYLCKETPRPGTHAVEHIIPTSIGGTNDATNLALACTACNSRKSNRTVSFLVTSGRPVYHASQANDEQ